MSKVCSKCGTENSDIRDTCMTCGEKLPNEVVTTQNNSAKKICIWSVIGTVIGCVVFVCGIITIFDPVISRDYPRTAEFGADFYTYIYDAVKDVAMNIPAAAEGIVRTQGIIIAAIGAFMTCYFGRTIKSE